MVALSTYKSWARARVPQQTVKTFERQWKKIHWRRWKNNNNKSDNNHIQLSSIITTLNAQKYFTFTDSEPPMIQYKKKNISKRDIRKPQFHWICWKLLRQTENSGWNRLIGRCSMIGDKNNICMTRVIWNQSN